MGKPDPEEEARLKKDCYYNFVAIFTWPPGEDKVAVERFGMYFNDPERLFDKTGLNPKHCDGYSLTGARTIIVIGLTRDAKALYLYCSELIHDTEIEAKVYHAVHTTELEKLVAQRTLKGEH